MLKNLKKKINQHENMYPKKMLVMIYVAHILGNKAIYDFKYMSLSCGITS